MSYIIIILSIVVFLIFFFKIIGIEIGIAKFEDTSKIRVINNSYLETFKNFIENTDYNYLEGKVIFFNTWASWCGACIGEIPILNMIQLSHRDNKKVVFVSYCNDLQPASIPEFLNRKNLELNYRFISSDEGLRVSLRKILSSGTNTYNVDPLVDSIPWNFIIDQNENVLYFKRGRLNEEDMFVINSILNTL